MREAIILDLLNDASREHHAAEQRLPSHSWSQWYAAYIFARTIGHSNRGATVYADARIRDA